MTAADPAVTADTAADSDIDADADLDAALTEEERELKAWMLEEAQSRGNAVVTVAEGTGNLAGVGNYAFTAGAWRTHNVPEAVVIGLPVPMATVLLDSYVDRAANGETFRPGMLVEDFFEGIPVLVERVHRAFYLEYFGSAFLLYPDGSFPAVQLVVPTPEGHWPWDDDAPEGFGRWQPVLTDSGFPESE